VSVITELVLINMVFWPVYSINESKWFKFKTNWIEFLPPAMLDWSDKIFLYIGLSQVSASLPAMIRGLVPPIAGYLSYLLFKAHFTSGKIVSIFVTIVGILLGCFVQLYFETKADEFKTTGIGILMLIISAFTQATQHVLEERIYR